MHRNSDGKTQHQLVSSFSPSYSNISITKLSKNPKHFFMKILGKEGSEMVKLEGQKYKEEDKIMHSIY